MTVVEFLKGLHKNREIQLRTHDNLKICRLENVCKVRIPRRPFFSSRIQDNALQGDRTGDASSSNINGKLSLPRELPTKIAALIDMEAAVNVRSMVERRPDDASSLVVIFLGVTGVASGILDSPSAPIESFCLFC